MRGISLQGDSLTPLWPCRSVRCRRTDPCEFQSQLHTLPLLLWLCAACLWTGSMNLILCTSFLAEHGCWSALCLFMKEFCPLHNHLSFGIKPFFYVSSKWRVAHLLNTHPAQLWIPISLFTICQPEGNARGRAAHPGPCAVTSHQLKHVYSCLSVWRWVLGPLVPSDVCRASERSFWGKEFCSYYFHGRRNALTSFFWGRRDFLFLCCGTYDI